MANGKPGDHPLTDILWHGMEVYGPEADELIRKMSRLSSPRELREWWEQELAGQSDPAEIHRRMKEGYDSFVQRAKDRGWEVLE